MLVSKLVPASVDFLNPTMYCNHPHICVFTSSALHLIFINLHIYWWTVILFKPFDIKLWHFKRIDKIIHGSPWNTVSFCNKWGYSMLVFKKYSKNQLLGKPSVLLSPIFHQYSNEWLFSCSRIYGAQKSHARRQF